MERCTIWIILSGETSSNILAELKAVAKEKRHTIMGKDRKI